MKRADYVWVELQGVVVRIFKGDFIPLDTPVHKLARMEYADAVKSIRHTLFIRSKGDCELCGSPITEKTGHMHEMRHRGKGGEISLENSVLACAACHKHQHRDREPKFTRRKQ